MAMIRKRVLPNSYAIRFIRRTAWKLAKYFDQPCELRFME